MTRIALALIVLAGTAHAAPKDKDKDKKPAAPEQAQADRYFKSGVQLFKEAKYSEALAEFMRAYEIAPHPLVLYNIAACHRELSHYGDAVQYYERFLAEGKGQVPQARLTAAQTELDSILARIARVTVTVTPDGATVTVDGNPIATLTKMPLILSPGDHKVIAIAAGYKGVERTVKVASGDELSVDLNLVAVPPEPIKVSKQLTGFEVVPTIVGGKDFKYWLGGSFGTNMMRFGKSGVPGVGIGARLCERFEVGVEATFVAYAVIPAVRAKLVGDEALTLHAVAAVPIAITDDGMTKTFVAGAAGLGLRFMVNRALSFRLESMVSYAGKEHGTTIPTFLGGQLWF